MTDAAQQNPSATVPGAQGSIIPLGWKPTVDKPVPVVRCIVIKKGGDRCGRWSLRGHTKCKSHLKNADISFPSVREHMDAVIEAARLRLVNSTDEALDTIEYLMENANGEQIRLKAASEILDRAGVRGGFEIDMEVKTSEDPSTELRKRLQILRDRHTAAQDDPIIGEVIEDADVVEQETLFDL